MLSVVMGSLQVVFSYSWLVATDASLAVVRSSSSPEIRMFPEIIGYWIQHPYHQA